MFKFKLTRLEDTSILFEIVDTDIDFTKLSNFDGDFDFSYEGYDCLFYNSEMTNIHSSRSDEDGYGDEYMDISLNNHQRAAIVKDSYGRAIINDDADKLMNDIPKVLKRFIEICPLK